MAMPLLGALYLYSRLLSYLLPPRCRFYPSCSQYAYQAIKSHGAPAGLLLSVRRLLKCHPWHPGGFDHVPEKSPLSCCHKTHNTQPIRNSQS